MILQTYKALNIIQLNEKLYVKQLTLYLANSKSTKVIIINIFMVDLANTFILCFIISIVNSNFKIQYKYRRQSF